MKRILFFLSLILILMNGVYISAETNNQILRSSKTLKPDNSYICGDFFADYSNPFASGSFDLIQMKIINSDTREIFNIPFNVKHQYCYYQLPQGRYKISSIELNYPRVSKTNSFLGVKIETEIVNLKVNPKILCEFNLNQGECLYIGDYYTFFVDKLLGTAKISLRNKFEEFSREIQKTNKNSQLAVRSLEINDIVPPTPYKAVSEYEKSVIACRLFINKDAPGKFELILLNLATKKRMRIEFLNNNQIQYIEVVPGEFYVENISFSGTFKYKSDLYNSLIPKELLLPFELNLHDVLYIGGIGLVWNNSQVSSLYINDFNNEMPQIQSQYNNDQFKILELKNN